jgi:hypothetical protein
MILVMMGKRMLASVRSIRAGGWHIVWCFYRVGEIKSDQKAAVKPAVFPFVTGYPAASCHLYMEMVF